MGAEVFFRNLESAVSSSSWLRLVVGTTEPKTGPMHVSDEWPFHARGSKAPNSDHAKWLHFLNIHPIKKHVFQICLWRTWLPHLFLTSNKLSPHLWPPYTFHPQIHKVSFLLRRLIWIFLSSPRLAALWINPFSAANLSVSVFGLLHSSQIKLVW